MKSPSGNEEAWSLCELLNPELARVFWLLLFVGIMVLASSLPLS
jgi:hypothetical protein